MQVDILAKSRGIEQAQQKIDIDAEDKAFKNSLSLVDLEMQAGRDLNAELQNNMLVFDVQTGDFA